MKPEDPARPRIDHLLDQAGWATQGQNHLNLGAERGVAVREFALSTGVARFHAILSPLEYRRHKGATLL